MTPVSAPRIAIGGFLHETNTFAPTMADLAAFTDGDGGLPLCTGDDIIAVTRGNDVATAGFVAEAGSRGWLLAPTLWCATASCAHVTEDAFETIAARLIAALAAALPLDGVYLDLSGAMVAEHIDDGDGELLARVREVVGPKVPIVASVDLHANLSATLIDQADALVACRTCPHTDMAATGRQAAVLLSSMLAGTRYARSVRHLPFLIPLVWQPTGMEPSASLYRMVAELCGGPVASLNFLSGFPVADVPHCGPSVVAYADDEAAAGTAAAAVYDKVCAMRLAYAGTTFEPLEAVEEARRIAACASRPVVVADVQDDPDCGSDANTTGMLKALVETGAERAAIGAIFDPAVAALAHEAGVGATIVASLGGSKAVFGDSPFPGVFEVTAIADGSFSMVEGPRRSRRMLAGRSACLRIGGVSIVVTSRRLPMTGPEMFRFVGIDPAAQAILVVKSSAGFRPGFEPMAAAILLATAPGPVPLSPAQLAFTKPRRGIDLSPTGPAFV
ncbi:M81 family metallopeptidase [Jiella sonneratiae]|uniref:Microcystinase C n=1 Tax=Jiella sonneratiae TaxID=2816856 RepID=A0ABS3J9V6_9HYPH|nr:M81 family metallopeptidase [Jiella sonneratiae]MBO0905708.1 M81 family metallopeptidase [Jiella sonneratiae]